jgi:PIN domain
VIKERRMLGLGQVKVDDTELDHRAYLTERLDEVLAITVMDWPTISHRELVVRAISRTPPFDHKGSGYRDSLVWADVVELAKAGHHVALASEDKIFAGQDGMLAPHLKAEVADVRGDVELVRDLGNWLLAQLSPSPASCHSLARTRHR